MRTFNKIEQDYLQLIISRPQNFPGMNEMRLVNDLFEKLAENLNGRIVIDTLQNTVTLFKEKHEVAYKLYKGEKVYEEGDNVILVNDDINTYYNFRYESNLLFALIEYLLKNEYIYINPYMELVFSLRSLV